VRKTKVGSPRKEKKPKPMDKERLKFFITCPFCQKKFGILPSVVFKYVDRVLEEFEKDLNQKGKEVRKGEPK